MKTDELKDKIYQAIGHAANADGIINQALATEYVMTNIQSELSTPSHSEEKENTGKQYTFKQGKEGFDIIKPDGFIFCCCGHLEEDAKDMCDSLNSYSTLKAENERLKEELEYTKRERDGYANSFLKLEAENDKRSKQLKNSTHGILVLCSRMEMYPDERTHITTIRQIIASLTQ